METGETGLGRTCWTSPQACRLRPEWLYLPVSRMTACGLRCSRQVRMTSSRCRGKHGKSCESFRWLGSPGHEYGALLAMAPGRFRRRSLLHAPQSRATCRHGAIDSQPTAGRKLLTRHRRIPDPVSFHHQTVVRSSPQLYSLRKCPTGKGSYYSWY